MSVFSRCASLLLFIERGLRQILLSWQGKDSLVPCVCLFCHCYEVMGCPASMTAAEISAGRNMKTGGPSNIKAWSSYEYDSLVMKPETCMEVKRIGFEFAFDLIKKKK